MSSLYHKGYKIPVKNENLTKILFSCDIIFAEGPAAHDGGIDGLAKIPLRVSIFASRYNIVEKTEGDFLCIF